MRETKKTRNRKKLAYVRYAYPAVMMAIMIVFMFIPCGSYVTDSGATEVMSASEQISYSWENAREVLFGVGGEVSEATKSLMITVLSAVVISALLFAVSLVFVVYFTYSCSKYMAYPSICDKGRAVFLTLVPNRTVSFIYLALCLPLAAFQRILALIYTWGYDVEVKYVSSFVDPLIIGVILLVVGIVISAVSRKGERLLGIDPFKKMIEESTERKTDEGNASDAKDKKDVEEYDDIVGRARYEQMEAIRRLLKNNENDTDEE